LHKSAGWSVGTNPHHSAKNKIGISRGREKLSLSPLRHPLSI